MLGVGDFYYELGVQIIELCVATSHRNGGVLSIEEVLKTLNRRRRPDNQISEYDFYFHLFSCSTKYLFN